jgi:hypothetical protein
MTKKKSDQKSTENEQKITKEEIHRELKDIRLTLDCTKERLAISLECASTPDRKKEILKMLEGAEDVENRLRKLEIQEFHK